MTSGASSDGPRLPRSHGTAGFDTTHALAGKEKRIVAGHDPLVGDRLKQVEPGIIKIA